jgi:L-seryl-tRNA(Ser) seleniumtransferase
MKVGKEGIVGAVAALERWESLDHRALHRHEYARVEALRDGLSRVDGVTVEEIPDPTGNPITRLRVRIDRTRSGRTVGWLAKRLRAGSPSIIVRDHHVDLEFFDLDPCNLRDGDVEVIVSRFAGLSDELLAAPPQPSGDPGPRMANYDRDGLPRADLDRVPWAFSRVAYGGRAHGMEAWPDAYLERSAGGADDA